MPALEAALAKANARREARAKRQVTDRDESQSSIPTTENVSNDTSPPQLPNSAGFPGMAGPLEDTTQYTGYGWNPLSMGMGTNTFSTLPNDSSLSLFDNNLFAFGDNPAGQASQFLYTPFFPEPPIPQQFTQASSGSGSQASEHDADADVDEEFPQHISSPTITATQVPTAIPRRTASAALVHRHTSHGHPPPTPTPRRTLSGRPLAERWQVLLHWQFKQVQEITGVQVLRATPSLSRRGDASDSEYDSSDNDSAGFKRQKKSKEDGKRVSDLRPIRQKIVKKAYGHFRACISTVNPYPSTTQSDEFALTAFLTSYDEIAEHLVTMQDEDDVPTDGEISLLKARISQMRGRVKTKARELVKKHYSFESTSEDNIDAINRNRALATKLKTDWHSFTRSDPDNRNVPYTLYRHAIIAEIINMVWFADKASDGAQYPDMFSDHSGIPLVLIALCLAAIECAIDEWQHGVQRSITFRSDAYIDVFQGHLTKLEAWERYTMTISFSKTTETICCELLNNARKNAGISVVVGSTSSAQASGLTIQDFAIDEGQTS
ncbi:hypothetical protein B0H21DRAFT_826308 [Amylocystis lapponica]|nr:hypothetical protein B0H21DRAFT_826308 [Amylocystis lapponica]